MRSYSSHRRALMAAVALFVLHQSAFAGQLFIDTGTVSQDGGTYTNIGNTQPQSAIYAIGSGVVLNANNLIIGDGGFSQPAVVGANDGAAIHLTGTTVVTGAHGLKTFGANSVITMTGGQINTTIDAAVAQAGGTITLNNVTASSSNTFGVVQATGGALNLNGGSVSATSASSGSRAVYVTNGGTVKVDGTLFSTLGTNSEAILLMQGTLNAKNFSISTEGSSSYGINANSNAVVTLENGSIHTVGQNASGIWAAPDRTTPTTVGGNRLTVVTEGTNAHGISADSNTTFTLTNSAITVASAFGLYAQNYYNTANGGKISYSNGSITVNGINGTAVLAVTAGSRIDLDTVDVKTTADGNTGLYSYSGALLTAKNSTVQVQGTSSYGLFVGSGSTAALTDTRVTTSGTNAFGVVFYGATALNTISITGGSVTAQDAAAVLTNGGTDVLHLKNTTLSGKGLAFYANDLNNGGTLYGAKLAVNADNSMLTGGARMSALSTNSITLQNGSTWTLTPAADGTVDSAVTSLTVNNSTVAFAVPTANNFQTLTTGAWNANGATLTMNTLLNAGGGLSNQQTDRLLVNGDVTGITMVKVTGIAGSPGGGTSLDGQNLSSEGISIIQVSGSSTMGAFQLLGGYTTLNGMPYQYTLHAYGPGASNGAADAGQRLVTGSGDYWDYRLQSVYVTPPSPPPGPGPQPDPAPTPQVPAVAPQVAAYLIAPVALFQAQLQDISNLHRRLGEIRDDGRKGGTAEFFIRAYGGAYTYNSNRNAYAYGYDANIDYAAVQLGGNLYAFEKGNSVTRFGIAGSIGSLSFDPKNVGYATKGDANTWSVSAHATYLHDSGFYVDGVASFGAFDGKVTTNVRGKTAGVKGTMFALSAETGYPIKLGSGLTLEPQAQLIYQRLMFDRQYDVDNFAVALGDQDQFLGRVGARLTKSFATGQDELLTVYAKANVLHAFSSGGRVFFGDTFRLGTFGTAVEAGVGVNAKMSKNLSLYADAAYQRKIGKSGVSGVSLTGGLRYSF